MKLHLCLIAGNAWIAWTALGAATAIGWKIGRQAGADAYRLTSANPAASRTKPDIAHALLAMLAAIAVTGTLFKATGCSMHDAYDYATGVAVGAISTYSFWMLLVQHLVKREA